jgi:hypothetical protein
VDYSTAEPFSCTAAASAPPPSGAAGPAAAGGAPGDGGFLLRRPSGYVPVPGQPPPTEFVRTSVDAAAVARAARAAGSSG